MDGLSRGEEKDEEKHIGEAFAKHVTIGDAVLTGVISRGRYAFF